MGKIMKKGSSHVCLRSWINYYGFNTLGCFSLHLINEFRFSEAQIGSFMGVTTTTFTWKQLVHFAISKNHNK